jgi:NAD(P)H dehydrogenase (quinone)
VSIVPAPLAVTGATGRIGGQVSALLADTGVPHRLLVRDPDRAPDVLGTTVHRAAYEDSVDTRAALDGVRTLFMVSASEHPDRQHQHLAFVDAADAMGVQHVVYLSFFGAAATATFTFARDHWATERHLRSTGMAVTFLRDNLYADFLPQMVGADDAIAGPGGTGRAALVAQADVARSAAAVLTDPRTHRDRTYNLTGPESVSFADAAALLSRVWGRPVSYRDETIDQAWESRRSYGAPDWMVEGWISTYLAVAAGELDGVSDDVRRLTGRDPLSLADVLTD